MPELYFEKIDDLGDQLKFTVRQANGARQEICTPKRVQGESSDPTEEEYQTILRRDFDLGSSQSLLFALQGGIGDIATQLGMVLRVRDFLKARSKKKFEYYALLQSGRDYFFRRFFEAVPVFHGFKTAHEPSEIKLKYPLKVLSARPEKRFYSDELALGSMTDFYWAYWGLPGKAETSIKSHYFKKFSEAAKKELKSFRKASPAFPNVSRYILICPEGSTGRARKDWSLQNWKTLVHSLLETTSLSIVFISSDETLKSTYRDQPRVFIFDPLVKPQENDLLRLAALVYGSRLTISVDTGPAHVADLIRKPCIVLWGPTHPTAWGCANNLNIRMSTCPPCGTRSTRASLCQDNLCMKQIRPESVLWLAQEALAGRYAPR